jgi:hypothetical protein
MRTQFDPVTNRRKTTKARAADPADTELLLTPDGRILVHNLTSAAAKLLASLDPGDAQLISRTLYSPSKS